MKTALSSIMEGCKRLQDILEIYFSMLFRISYYEEFE